MQQYVAGFMFSTDRNTVALVQKLKPRWQSGFLNAIGGKVEPGESVFGAMQREFREETGVDFEGWQPFVRLYRKDVYEVYFFTAFSDDVYKAATMEDEPITILPAAIDPKFNYLPNVHWLLPMALDANLGRKTFIQIEDVAGN